ncbi:hypothetical protein PUNSTDRAFT_138089 [Punctularia strigosozonata HHB-11173 SS5]|uniref:Endonuclease/exonuclease/phosphatase domain-containing protein n=1 Tax=Punctularia strigosozonata (strain HHB-11173) TaxID=741275 RepID=R7S5Q8_PUNST|nr:uncharacterized protein PUNSTDRAFT_138089 [Punctularia strigosozonata HHB-11173 SS5]EIN04891.1 hypothetical protein PUNSTDRAFT_138089 [Punctularia strigosozonata HHB-11173 SS5]
MAAQEDLGDAEPAFIVTPTTHLRPAGNTGTHLGGQDTRNTTPQGVGRRQQEIALLVTASLMKGSTGTLDSERITDVKVSRDDDLPPPPPDSAPEGKLAIIDDQLIANRAYTAVDKDRPRRVEIPIAQAPAGGWTMPHMRFRLQQLEDIQERQVRDWAEEDENLSNNILITVFDKPNLSADDAQDAFGEVRAVIQAFLEDGARLRIIMPVAADKRQPRTGLLTYLTAENKARILTQGVFASADVAFLALSFDDIVVNPLYYLTLKGPLDVDADLMLYAVQVALAGKASNIVMALGMDPNNDKAIEQVNNFIYNLECQILPFLVPKGRPQPRYNIYGPVINTSLPCAYRDVHAIMSKTNFWHSRVGPVEQCHAGQCTFCYGVDHVYGLCPIREQIPAGFHGSTKNSSTHTQDQGRRGEDVPPTAGHGLDDVRRGFGGGNAEQVQDDQAPKGPKRAKHAHLKVATLNMNGHTVQGGTPLNKWNDIHAMMRDNKIAIIALQETHLTEQNLEAITRMYGKRLWIYNSADPEQPSNSAGVDGGHRETAPRAATA